MYTRENPLIMAKESRNRNMMRLSEQSLELVSFFKEARRNFIYFSPRKAKN
jgi:hypothetical protein